MTDYTRIQLRRDTSETWTVTNPVLFSGEPGFETDTFKLKIGDGSTPWVDLPYESEVGDVISVNGLQGVVVLPTERLDTFVLNGTDITNKYVVLSTLPDVAQNVSLSVKGQGSQFYSYDYVMLPADAGKRLSWSTLGLDGVIASGDVIAIRYLG